MLRGSIRNKIVSIAIGLIILMVITSALSIVMAGTVSHLLDELTNKYIPAYGHLARADIRSVERGLALRQMVIAKMQNPPDETGYAEHLKVFEETDPQMDQEAQAARKLINSIIDDKTTPSNNIALTRLDDRIDTAVNDLRRHLNEDDVHLLEELKAQDFAAVRARLAQVDELRAEFNRKLEDIRSDMLTQVYASAVTVIGNQRQAVVISIIVTALAAMLGFVFAFLVSSGITRPVLSLLAGAREVEAGRLDGSIAVTTHDEIGQLSAAFNRMVEQLRQKKEIQETFGRYIDPRIVAGLIDQQGLTATEGQRRVMTVMFCDMKGFSKLSEGMTPQGLVKIMNHYLTTMSGPIHDHRGIIDKYIGDAIMAYWGPPFIEDADQARFACLAAVDMIGRIETFRKDLPELLGVRAMPAECDLRIGVATGEALVGSIGSEFMMNYTVMGDTVNLASRLEAANKLYGTHALIAEDTVRKAGADIEFREIDRVFVAGQSRPQVVFELMGRHGELTPHQDLLRARYADGLLAYRAGRFDEARAAFKAAVDAVPGDGPSAALLSRIEALQKNPPAADWDGAWHIDSK
jgi:class 3 adenylate cyclase